MKTWTDEEVEVMRNYFPIKTNEEIQKLLPSKSYRSITIKANRLGLKKTPELRSLMQQGNNNHFANKTHSETTKAHLKEKWSERKEDPDWQHPWVGRQHTKESKEKISKHYGEHYKSNEGRFKGKSHTDETRQQMSKPHNMSEEGSEALRKSIMSRPGGGYGNWTEYYSKLQGKNVWLQSSYEVRIATRCDELDFVTWTRNSTARVKWFDKDKKEHYYYPDFNIYTKGTRYYVEAKGEHLLGLEDTKAKIKAASEQWGVRFILATEKEIEYFENNNWFPIVK